MEKEASTGNATTHHARGRHVRLAALLLALGAGAATANTVIVQDAFSLGGFAGDVVGRAPDTVNLPGGQWGCVIESDWGQPFIRGSDSTHWAKNAADLEEHKACIAISLAGYNEGSLRISADVAFSRMDSAEGLGLGFRSSVPGEGYRPKVDPTKNFTGLGGVARSPVWENFRFDTTPGGPPPELPPLPPSGIVAVPGDGEVALTWRPMHAATGYRVKWSLDPLGPFADLATVAEPAYTHAPLANGTKHYYVISATNAVGEGQISKRAHGTPFAAGTGPGGSTIIGTPGSFGDHDNTIQKVFDGSLSTAFDAPVATGAWVGLDYGTARVFTQIQYAPRADQPARMVGGVFQGANAADFSDAVTLFTVASAPTAGSMTTQSVDNATPFRYVRYLGPQYGFCNIAEMDFATAGGGGDETAVPPAITTHPTNVFYRIQTP